MPEFPYLLAAPTYFYDDDELFFTEEQAALLLPIGTGLIWGDGTRYRVIDVWWSYDKHAPIDWGLHVFLKRVHPGSADDRPKRLEPTYFREDPAPVLDRFVNPDDPR